MKISPQYDAAGDFSDGLAPVAIPAATAISTSQRKFAINPQFDQGGSFRSGIAPVWVGNRQGYINKDGKYVWNPVS